VNYWNKSRCHLLSPPPRYDRFQWKCYTSEICRIEELKFLSTSSNGRAASGGALRSQSRPKGVGSRPLRILVSPISPYFPHFFWNQESDVSSFWNRTSHFGRRPISNRKSVWDAETSDLRLDVSWRRPISKKLLTSSWNGVSGTCNPFVYEPPPSDPHRELKSPFETVPQDTEESRFLYLVNFGDHYYVGFSVESVKRIKRNHTNYYHDASRCVLSAYVLSQKCSAASFISIKYLVSPNLLIVGHTNIYTQPWYACSLRCYLRQHQVVNRLVLSVVVLSSKRVVLEDVWCKFEEAHIHEVIKTSRSFEDEQLVKIICKCRKPGRDSLVKML